MIIIIYIFYKLKNYVSINRFYYKINHLKMKKIFIINTYLYYLISICMDINHRIIIK